MPGFDNQEPKFVRRIACAAAFAVGVTLIGASDWELDVGGEHICAKSQQTCELAVDAMRRGWLFRDLHGHPSCHPQPECFSDESERIIPGRR